MRTSAATGGAQTLHDAADGVRAQLVGGAVGDEDRAHLGDDLALLEIVLPQRGAGLDEIDDEVGQPDEWRELDRALHDDDLRAHAARGEVRGGNARILRRDTRHVRDGRALRAGDDEAAATDAE